MNQDDTGPTAQALMTTGAAGRAVTRVLLDHSVTLQIWELDQPTVEFKFEGPFVHTVPGAGGSSIDPENLGRAANEVAALFGAIVDEINVDVTGELTLTFEDGRRIEAPPEQSHESWSYVADDGGRIICTAGGHLAVWDPSQNIPQR